MRITPLPPPDSQHLLAAQGWLELGDHLAANEELDRIQPQLRGHPDVLEVRWGIFAKGERWDACYDVAHAIIKQDPQRSDAWIHRSYALHELKRTQDAYEQLLPAAEAFSGVWLVPYNLACYAAQLARLDECRLWFAKAMDIDGKAVKRAAIDDPDLEPLWKSLGDTP